MWSSSIGDMDYMLNYYLNNSRAFGGCQDEASFVAEWCRSAGIAPFYFYVSQPATHFAVGCYDPSTNRVEIYEEQINKVWGQFPSDSKVDFAVLRYPIPINFQKVITDS